MHLIYGLSVCVKMAFTFLTTICCFLYFRLDMWQNLET